MAFVKLSASWAPLGTHLNFVPSRKASLIDRAISWTLNSEQLGGAVLVIRSYKLLQSVMATSSEVTKVGTVMAGCSLGRASSGLFQSVLGSWIQLQKSRNHASWSKVDAKAIVSADKVLVTTFWILRQPQVSGLIGHWCPWLMSWCVPTMMEPAWESGFLAEENDASENAISLKFCGGIGLIVIVTSWWRLASWSTLLASIRVSILAEFIADCRNESLLERSGRVLIAAYWRLPITPRRASRSDSVTGSSSWLLRLHSMEIGLIFLTYVDWLRVMLLSPCWVTSIPVNVKADILWEPKANVFSSSRIFASKTSLPPPMPSSTWTPKIPSSLPGWPFEDGDRSTKQHGSKGEVSKPSLRSSDTKAQYQRYGASIRPYALLFNLHISFGFMDKAFLSSGTGSTAITLSAWGWPWRKAALMSKDLSFHMWDEITCKAIIREVLLRVGLSLGISSMRGSKYPSTTRRALALWLFIGFEDSSLWPTLSSGFQVRIQRHFRICSSGIWFRRIVLIVLVLTQFWISDSFAFSNSLISSGVKVDNFTSVRCFLADVANMIHDSSSLGLQDPGSSVLDISNSHLQAVFSTASHVRAFATSWQVSCTSSTSPVDWPLASWSAISGVFVWDDSGVTFSGSWSGCGTDSSWLSFEMDSGLFALLDGLLDSGLLPVMGLLTFEWDWWSFGMSYWSCGLFEVVCIRLICWRRGVTSSGNSGPSGLPSSGKASRVFSGALRYSWPLDVHQTVWLSSWITTLWGPCHLNCLRGFSLHIMTHDPCENWPREGHALRNAARRRTSWLSAMWYALLAVSLTDNICRNSWLGRDWFSLLANSCAGMDSSLKIDPGILECFPNTITSGAYPWRILNAFLACVHWFKAIWRDP